MEEKNARLQALIEGIIYKLAPITNVYNVYVDKNTTLAKKLSEIITSLNGKAKSDDVGDVSELITEAKDSVVSAINEVYGKIGESIDENAIYQIVAEYLTENPPSGIHIGTEAPTDPNVDVWIDTDEEAPENENGIDVIAEVGQTIVVEAVDADGKPTAWKAVDFPEAQQSDWNAAEGEPGHVLNRTHWAENVVETLFAQDVTITSNQFSTQGQIGLVAVETYTVLWDGVEYNCKAALVPFYNTTAIVVGNLALMGGANTGEPFIIGDAATGYMAVAAAVDGTYSVSVTQKKEVVRYLPEKFLSPIFDGGKTYVLTLPEGALGDDTNLVGEHEITTVSYDEFADILWHGGNLLIDFSAVCYKYVRSKVAYWVYGANEFVVYAPVASEREEALDLTGRFRHELKYIRLTFTNGTWTPPV